MEACDLLALAPQAPTTGDGSATLRVLLADPNPAVTDCISNKLESICAGQMPIEVVTAHSAAEVKSLISCRDFDLLIMETCLPDENGITVCRELRQSGVQVRITLMSRQMSARDFMASRDAGAEHFLSKPIDNRDLKAVLRLVALRRLAAA